VDGERVTLEISGQDGQKSVTTQLIFVDADHFEFAPPVAGGKSFLFARVKQQ
jgi:hypothetical protein